MSDKTAIIAFTLVILIGIFGVIVSRLYPQRTDPVDQALARKGVLRYALTSLISLAFFGLFLSKVLSAEAALLAASLLVVLKEIVIAELVKRGARKSKAEGKKGK